MQRADEERLVGARGFVGSVDRFCLPVGPVDVVLKQGQREDVRDVLAQYCGGPQGVAVRPGPPVSIGQCEVPSLRGPLHPIATLGGGHSPAAAPGRPASDWQS